jgi:hypothetical protein
MKSALIALACLVPLSAGAADPSYLSVVGEIVGKVEAHRILRDYCAKARPEAAAANAAAYDSWRERNAALLQRVDAQRAHVDKILARQASRNPDPASPNSAAEVVASMEKLFSAELDKLDKPLQQTVCARFGDSLAATEATWQAEIGELLDRASTIEKSLVEP